MMPKEPSAKDAQKRKMDVSDGIEKVMTRDTLALWYFVTLVLCNFGTL
jgi:hypothetical protein